MYITEYLPTLDTSTLILTLINQHSQIYLWFSNTAFWDPNSAPICTSRKRSGHVLLSRAHGMSDNPSFQPEISATMPCLSNTNMCQRMLNDYINNVKYQMLANIQL